MPLLKTRTRRIIAQTKRAQRKREQGARIRAMISFVRLPPPPPGEEPTDRRVSAQDMTAFIARNATETIALIATQADAALTNWTLGLSDEYISVPAGTYDFGP